MIVNGMFFFFLGEYPSDTKALDQISKGRFNLSTSYLLYFFSFIGLTFAGVKVQNNSAKNFEGNL